MPSRLLLPLLVGCAAAALVGASSTPEPPVSYDCQDEGFFPHPKDCRKYFWCLDSGPANLGIVPHHFTCPSGLYFNTKTEACDYPNNVPCAHDKKNKTILTRTRTRKKPSSTTEASADAIGDEIIVTTLLPEAVAEDTTLPPVTTTAAASSTKAPSRLLKEAGVGSRQRRPTKPAQTTTATSTPSPTSSVRPEDNLKQLLHLVQSLGGVERIKTLVNEKEPPVANEINARETERAVSRQRISGSNSRPHETTPASFFSPSYETPRRPEAVTETPNVLASNAASSNPIRHRRPQFDHSSPTPHAVSESPQSPAVTVNPFLSYADPSRGTSIESDPSTDPPITDYRGNSNDFRSERGSRTPQATPAAVQTSRLNQQPPPSSFYSFSYNTPGSRVSVQGQAGLPQSSFNAAPADSPRAARPPAVSLPLNSPFNDPFFAYNTPGRLGPQSTHAVETTASLTTVTEPPTSVTAAVVAASPPRGTSRQRQSSRGDGGFVRVRVNPGGNLRFSEPGAHQGSSGRRATRVRVANPSRVNPANLLNQPLPAIPSPPVPHNPRNHHANSLQSGGNPPSVLYEEDRELHHINTDVSRTEVPVEIVTTRRPPRRRPPQREHLRNRQEDNPVGALVNLPPPNLQFDPSQSFPPASGHGGVGRPFPPRPQTLPPLASFPTTRSLPRILPIAVPLVTLPPPSTASLPQTEGQPASLPAFPADQTDSGLQPGTVRYSSLNLPSNPLASPRPHFEDLFVTEFPFFGDNSGHTPPSPSTRLVPVTLAPTTAATTSTTTHAPPTTEYHEPPVTRRQRQRRPTAAPQETRPTRRRETVTTPPPPPPLAPSAAEDAVPSGPPVEMESGHVKCTRRGVFAHPGSCGQFVVCAPASRGSLSYRSYMHHCPAEQVFVEEVGRCRPGNKEKCEVFTR